EPKTADEGVRSMENMLKGLTGAAAPNRPFFGVTVEWERGAEAEATMKGTIAAVGGGMPGGKLEPVEGLGDRASWGQAGMFLYVRKGSAFLTVGMNAGTREQAIELAKIIVPRLQ